MYDACLIICVPHASSVLSGQKGVLEPLERELGWVPYPPPTLRATNLLTAEPALQPLDFYIFRFILFPFKVWSTWISVYLVSILYGDNTHLNYFFQAHSPFKWRTL